MGNRRVGGSEESGIVIILVILHGGLAVPVPVQVQVGAGYRGIGAEVILLSGRDIRIGGTRRVVMGLLGLE